MSLCTSIAAAMTASVRASRFPSYDDIAPKFFHLRLRTIGANPQSLGVLCQVVRWERTINPPGGCIGVEPRPGRAKPIRFRSCPGMVVWSLIKLGLPPVQFDWLVRFEKRPNPQAVFTGVEPRSGRDRAGEILMRNRTWSVLRPILVRLLCNG